MLGKRLNENDFYKLYKLVKQFGYIEKVKFTISVVNHLMMLRTCV